MLSTSGCLQKTADVIAFFVYVLGYSGKGAMLAAAGEKMVYGYSTAFASCPCFNKKHHFVYRGKNLVSW